MGILMRLSAAIFLMVSCADAKIKVVASFSILADLATHVGGDHVDVVALVGPGSDAHAFEPRPQDVRLVAEADVVVVNGLGFEGWIDRLVSASGTDAHIKVLSEGIVPETRDGGVDPHAWQSAAHVQTYVANIADVLCAADGQNCPVYEANAKSFGDVLRGLDRDIMTVMTEIPLPRRVVITSHDAFGYFASHYDVTFHAPQGVSSASEASAKAVADLINQIRSTGATALFVEAMTDPRLIAQIARETGLPMGGTLYSDALSATDGPAPTYVAMMRHNAELLTAAMRSKP